jgi:hypothetical protein
VTNQPATPAPPPIEVDPTLVIRELCSTELGRALWGEAQWRVAADVLQRRVVELESQRAPAAPATASES